MDGIYAAMKRSFCDDELRGFTQTCALLSDGRYCLFHIVEGGRRVGYISVWELEGFAFVEHFAVYEDFRGAGIGGKAIELICKNYAAVALEAERPANEIARRRIDFYARHGFALNPQDYVQPAYRKGGSPVPMRLMSYPQMLDDYDGVVARIYSAVYGITA